MSERSHLSIGEVLSLLREEFPDVTISKIRFLESQGLVDPERTPSGYRKFYDHDVDRLRWILRQQREHFLPLKVIRGRLTDPGEETDELGLGEGLSEQTGQAFGARVAEMDDQLTDQMAEPAGSASASPGIPDSDQALPVADPEPEQVTAAVSTRAAGSDKDLGLAARPAPPTTAEKPPDRQAAQMAASAPGPSRRSSEARPPRPASPPTAPVTPSLFADARSDPARPAGPAPKPAATARRGRHSADEPESYSAEELAAAAGATGELVDELKQFGLVSAHAVVAGAPYFDECALAVTRAAAEFARYGVEVRHLRAWRNAADREAGLFEQIVLPLLRQRNPQARQHAAETLADLARLGGDLRSALLDQAIRDIR
jgi:DNA-binding transcriptional MerR regulator